VTCTVGGDAPAVDLWIDLGTATTLTSTSVIISGAF
jgi:hypothetical protein